MQENLRQKNLKPNSTVPNQRVPLKSPLLLATPVVFEIFGRIFVVGQPIEQDLP
jgi:hypothetical protein